MPPTSLLVVDHLQRPRLALPFADVPRGGFELFVVAACGRPHNLAIHSQLEASLSWMIASADQERDRAMGDCERLRCEFSGEIVVANPRVQQPFSLKAADRVLIGITALCRAFRKRRTFDFPLRVAVGLKVFEHFVRPLSTTIEMFFVRRSWRPVQDFAGREQQLHCLAILFHRAWLTFFLFASLVRQELFLHGRRELAQRRDGRVDLAAGIEIRRLPS